MTTSSSYEQAGAQATGRDTSVALENVSLRFRKYGSHRPTLKQTVINKIFRRTYREVSDYWLFEGLNLRIEHGQRLGVVGANGAGKSTLMKLICGIYKPTSGAVRVSGQIAPLLELGAGFNPELSGTENVFLNGAMLGFGPSEMEAKLDRIIEFSGLQEFASTPIKYYSTGMLLRLAFSVATDIEPEILIVDEIFAGGDAEFVTKAKDRMMKLMDDSHIVITVSHDLKVIRDLCNRAIWLDRGRIVADGDPAEICKEYLNKYARPGAGGKSRQLRM